MPLKRDRATLLAYVGLGLLGFVLNGLGPVLPNIQQELGLTRSEVARYPSLYAVGWLLMSAVGYRVVKRVGRDLALRLSAIGLGASGGFMGLALSPTLVGAAAIVMGGAGAVMMIVVQAFLSDHHGTGAVAAISEANAVSSFAAIAGPLAVALAIAVGFGWAAGFAAPALVVGGLLGLGLVASIPSSVESSATGEDQVTAPAFPWLRSWIGIVLVVALEFAFVFWSTDYMESIGGISKAAAA
jgi:MFS family permease